jgi:hypothetical protein
LFDAGFTFLTQARWRFLNLLRIPFGRESDGAQFRLYNDSMDRLGDRETSTRSIRELQFDRYDDVPETSLKALEPARGVLDALAAEPYESSARIWAGVPAGEPPPGELLVWSALLAAGSHAAGLRDLVTSWSERWHLHTEWVLDSALQTLALWHRDPQAYEHRIWELPPFEVFGGPDLVATVPGWTPASTESIDEHKKMIDDQFRTLRRTHITEVDEQAKREGWPQRPVRFGMEAYVWLIEHNVIGRSIKKISHESDRDFKQVHTSISDLSELLEIPVRGSKPESSS